MERAGDNSDDAAEQGSAEPGTVIAGRYRLERAIGTGGMATIWEATHLALKRSVAVKFIDIAGRNAAAVRARFLREARVAAAVQHRNVVDIVDFGTDDDGRPFMVMERLVGSTLAQRLDTGPSLSTAESVRIVAGVLSGLAAVHDAGIVHRDLKPENVFLVEDADGTYPKVLDFGVSRAIDPTGELQSVLPTVENAIVGTPQYMSPEQARGLATIDFRSDLWSTGVILFELLSGVMPFDAEAIGDVIIRIATAEPPDLLTLRPDLRGPIADVVKRAMQRDPEDRYQSAREMRAALLAAVARTAASIRADGGRTGARGELASTFPETPSVEPKELLRVLEDAYEPGDSKVVQWPAGTRRPRSPRRTARTEARSAHVPARRRIATRTKVLMLVAASVLVLLALGVREGPMPAADPQAGDALELPDEMPAFAPPDPIDARAILERAPRAVPLTPRDVPERTVPRAEPSSVEPPSREVARAAAPSATRARVRAPAKAAREPRPVRQANGLLRDPGF